MHTYTFVLNAQYTPPVAKRKQHVLILIEDEAGRFILGQKKVYPEGIYRMAGGGMDAHETPVQAAKRELYEELSLVVTPKMLTQLATVIFHISDKEEKKYIFTTHIFFLKLKEQPLLPGDDLESIQRLDITQVEALIQRYRQLPKPVDHLLKFSWQDYGRIYGPMHEIALKEWKNYFFSPNLRKAS